MMKRFMGILSMVLGVLLRLRGAAGSEKILETPRRQSQPYCWPLDVLRSELLRGCRRQPADSMRIAFMETLQDGAPMGPFEHWISMPSSVSSRRNGHNMTLLCATELPKFPRATYDGENLLRIFAVKVPFPG